MAIEIETHNQLVAMARQIPIQPIAITGNESAKTDTLVGTGVEAEREVGREVERENGTEIEALRDATQDEMVMIGHQEETETCSTIEEGVEVIVKGSEVAKIAATDRKAHRLRQRRRNR